MKVLIYAFKSQLAPIGGPLGYLYNLKQEIDKNHDASIEFIQEDFKYESWKRKIRDIRCTKLRTILIRLKNIYKYWLLVYGRKHYAQINLSNYDAVHFHSSLDMYSVRDSLSEYTGKVIFTSHSPTLLSFEIWDKSSWLEKLFLRIFRKLKQMDTYAFNRADYFIFPCPEAEEPYYHAWKEYADFKKEHQEKYRYLLTGIRPCKVKDNRENICKKYNIPLDSFIFCYVGRHNSIKGYDLLKEYAKEFLCQHHNVYFLIAGKEEPYQRLKNERWIEVGWTNDPHSLIAASDAFILPNRETYFDLILLEVLSLGKIVIASSTGGNKHFTNIESVFLYNSKHEALNIMDNISKMSLAKRKNLEIISKNTFVNNYTCEIFYDNYKHILNSISANNKQ